MFAGLGLQDRCSPAAQTLAEPRSLPRRSTAAVTARAYAHAGHGLLARLGGERACGIGIPPPSWPVGFLDEVTGWVVDELASAPPRPTDEPCGRPRGCRAAPTAPGTPTSGS